MLSLQRGLDFFGFGCRSEEQTLKIKQSKKVIKEVCNFGIDFFQFQLIFGNSWASLEGVSGRVGASLAVLCRLGAS